jgi:predicted transcriptional regulator
MKILKHEEIRAMRMKLGLTQTQLAQLAGVTQAYIAKIEAGKADPRVSTLEKILAALGRAAPKKRTVAGEIMTSPIIYIKPTDKIRKAVRLMESHGISQLPVLDKFAQVGSISETTLMRKIADRIDLSKLMLQKVEKVMEGPFPAVDRGTDVDTVYRLLEHSPAVLVVERGRPAGIVTKADVLKLARGKSS